VLKWQLIASVSAAGAAILSAFFIAFQSYYTRLLVKTTTQASIDGNIQLAVVPRGGTGALNLRVENVGAGTADNVEILFQEGLKGILGHGIQDVFGPPPARVSLGSMAPKERREWSLVLPEKAALDQLPELVPYKVSYEVPRASRLPCVRKTHGQRVTRSGVLDMQSYVGTVIRAYVGLEDIVKSIEDLIKLLDKASPNSSPQSQ